MLSCHSWKEFMDKSFIEIALRLWLALKYLNKDTNILIIHLLMSERECKREIGGQRERSHLGTRVLPYICFISLCKP